MGTAIVLTVVVIGVILAVRSMIRDKSRENLCSVAATAKTAVAAATD